MEKRNRETSFFLWSLETLFLLFRPERKFSLFSGSSFCLYMVHTSRLSRPANSGRKKWETQPNSVVFQILVSFTNVLTTIYFSMVYTFCPGIISAFRRRQSRSCLLHLSQNQPFIYQASLSIWFVIFRNSMWVFFFFQIFLISFDTLILYFKQTTHNYFIFYNIISVSSVSGTVGLIQQCCFLLTLISCSLFSLLLNGFI